MRAITLLFIFAISFNSINSEREEFTERYDQLDEKGLRILNFYNSSHRPLGIEGVYTHDIIDKIEWIITGDSSNKSEYPNRYVSREDLNLYNPFISTFAIELSKLKEFQEAKFSITRFPVNKLKYKLWTNVSAGNFAEVDELIIADEIIDILKIPRHNH